MMATCKNLSMNNKKKSVVSSDHVVKELQCLFGQTLHIEIIRSVASSCDFDINRSSNLLLEMTSNVQNDEYARAERAVKAKKTPPNSFPSPLVRKTEVVQQRLPTSVSSGAITKKSKKTLEFENIIKKIQQGFKVLVILRGLPGSGKSYLAKKIAQVTLGPGNVDHHILSTDDYFKTPKGYKYDPTRIQLAHEWNHTRALKAMIQGLSPVIIDNTNCQMWEMKPYAMMAMDYAYYVEILEPDTWWCFNDKELAKRNLHGVPKTKIKDMIDRYDKNLTAAKLLSMYSLRYEFGKNPPQFRNHPPINNSRRTTAIQMNGLTNFESDASIASASVRKSRSTTALSSAFEIVEPLNLMDFDDTKLNDNNDSAPNYTTVDKTNNPVDEILMCSEDNSSSVLQPEVPKDKQDVKKLFDSGRQAWGLDEQALQSWDMVVPLEYVSAGPVAQESFATFSEDIEKESNEIGIGVDPNIIIAVTRGEVPEGCKILQGTSRYISSGSVAKVPFSTPHKKVMHDKSCWTDVDLPDESEDAIVIQQLLGLFPSVRRSYMKHLYNSCSKNFNMTMDVLVEDNSQHLADGSKTDNESDSEDIFGAASLVAQNHRHRASPAEMPAVRKATSPKHVSKEAVELKKAIENKVDIDKKHYSKHVLKVKQYKFGHYDDEQLGIELADMSTSPSNVDYVEDSQDEDSCDLNEGDPKDLVELNLGEVFAAQLETKFGFMENLPGFQPVVQMPVGLARQIYMLYLESVFQQMDAQKQVLEGMAKEDEEFARKLQSKEDELVRPQRELSLNEIMDEQMAANYYKRDAERWKSMSADNLAAKLTRQKLFTAFPFVDQDSILEILHANNNNYTKTVEDLYSSVGPDGAHGPKEAIEQPPLSPDTLTEMKTAEEICADAPKAVALPQENHFPATYYREKANEHLQRRTDLYQKARGYIQKGMTEVAMFYSDLATKETQSYDMANNLAANVFLQEHSQRLQSHNTLDLHYLYVKEAVAALDVFVDQNIDALHNRTRDLYQELLIITGRGKNSHGGVSKIKPAVITRLKKRKIMFSELNPGLLKIKVTRNTLLSCDFAT